MKIQVSGMVILLAGFLVFTGYSLTALPLDTYVSITMPPSPVQYTLTLPKQIIETQSLYVILHSPLRDPSYSPILTLTMHGNLKLKCEESQSDFMAICMVQNANLKPEEEIGVEVKCSGKCKLKLIAFLSTVMRLDLNTVLDMNPDNQQDGEYQIQIPIDLNIDFKQIKAELTIKSIDQEQTVRMVGSFSNNTNLPFPTVQKHQFQSVANYEGLAILISKQQIPNGTKFLNLFISVPPLSFCQLSVTLIANEEPLLIGKPLMDAVSAGQPKSYLLDFRNMSLSPQETIQFTLIVYSGAPTSFLSFDGKKSLSLYDSSEYTGDLRVDLTGDIRKQHGFNGFLYLKIESGWTSFYRIIVKIDQRDWINIDQGITDFALVPVGGIQNIIYDYYYHKNKKNSSQGDNPKLNFTLKTEVLQGAAVLGIRQCLPKEFNNSTECLLNLSQLSSPQVQKSFDNLQGSLLHYSNVYEISFSVLLKQCQMYYSIGDMERWLCKFHAVIVNQNRVDFEASVTVYHRGTNILLAEGKPFKDHVTKGMYNYYVFKIGNLKQISSITFHATILSGKCRVLGSQSDSSPEIIDASLPDSDVRLASATLRYNSSDLTSQKIYLGVYGDERTGYILTATVERKGNNSDGDTVVVIKEGTGRYEINGKSKFQILLTDNGEYLIDIVEVSGQINATLPASICKSAHTSYGYSCTFHSNSTFNFSVQGKLAVITISLTKQQNCRSAQLSYPLFVNVKPKGQICVQFEMQGWKDKGDIQVLVLAEGMVDRSVISGHITIGSGNASLPVTQDVTIIPKEHLEMCCPPSTNKLISCPLFLTLTNPASSPLAFTLSAQELTSTLVLLDGITMKIQRQEMDKGDDVRMMYKMERGSNEGILRITHWDFGEYLLAGVLVSEQDYLTSNNTQSIWPWYPPSNLTASFILRTLQASSPMASISINFSECRNPPCLLLLSLFATLYTPTTSLSVTLTQKQFSISLGQSQIGYLSSKMTTITYELSAPSEMSLVTVKEMGSTRKDCFGVKVFGINDVSFFNQIKSIDGEALLTSEYFKYFVLVEGKSASCTFRITYTSLKTPLGSLMEFYPYPFSLTESKSMLYLLYQQKHQMQMLVYLILKSGSCILYAQPLTLNNTIKQIIDKPINKWSIAGQRDGQLKIGSSQCKDQCFYVIAVKGDTKGAEGQVAVVPSQQSLVLTANGAVHRKMTQYGNHSYQYYSIFGFNLTISILHGSFSIKLLAPTSQVIANKTLTGPNTISLPVPHAKQYQNQSVDFYDDRVKYTIVLSGEGAYIIQIITHKQNFRLPQGYPFEVLVGANQPYTIQLLNLGGEDVNLQLGVTPQNENNFVIVKMNAVAEDQISGKERSIKVTEIHSDDSYQYRLQKISGVYYITFLLSVDAYMSLLYTKQALTHLLPTKSSIFHTQSIFEIYTPAQQFMVELWQCRGKVKLMAGKDYVRLRDGVEVEVVMEHSNVAGHYVVKAQGQMGEFFLRVDDQSETKNQSLLYMLSYTPYTNSFPYSHFNFNPDLTYTIEAGVLKVSLPYIALKFQSQSMVRIEDLQFSIIVGKNRQATEQMLQCGIGQLGGKTLQQNIKAGTKELTYQIENIRRILQNTESNTFYLGVSIEVSLILPTSAAPIPLEFSSTLLQLPLLVPGQLQQSTSAVRFIILWIIAPLIIAGFMLLVALKFCYGKWKEGRDGHSLFQDEKEDSSTHGFTQKNQNK